MVYYYGDIIVQDFIGYKTSYTYYYYIQIQCTHWATQYYKITWYV